MGYAAKIPDSVYMAENWGYLGWSSVHTADARAPRCPVYDHIRVIRE